MEDKFILDACCGGKMCWFNKNHPNALYLDERTLEKGTMPTHPNFEVAPDVIGDYRDMTFKDKSFKLVMWDPPHIVRLGNKSWMSQKYGMLGLNWKEDLTKGFNECWRVLEDHGVLVFKWSEPEISLKEVLSLFHTQPLFGHTSGRSGKTKWCCFMKIPTCSPNLKKTNGGEDGREN